MTLPLHLGQLTNRLQSSMLPRQACSVMGCNRTRQKIKVLTSKDIISFFQATPEDKEQIMI